MQPHPLHNPVPERFYLTKVANQVVGCGMLAVATARIDAMFVLPAYFRRGVGRAMMRHLEQVARDYGL
jgi:GNAT superfamily N-acetyltransferase